MKHILSLDGGGIRGIVPARILQRLEEDTGKLTRDMFDLVAGTSTGAIVACCIAKGIPAATIVDLYFKEGKRIFNRGWNIFGLFGAKYPAVGLEAVLDEYLGDTLVSDSKPVLLIPTLDLTSGMPHFFKSTKPEPVKLSYAARCSSAAPTYFAPKDNMIDGGVFSNNPGMCALAEAYKLWPQERLQMLSLGTGFKHKAMIVRRGGIFDYASIIIDIFMNSEMGYIDYECDHVLEDGDYCRVQEPLFDHIDDALDNTSTLNMEALMHFADTIYGTNAGRMFTVMGV